MRMSRKERIENGEDGFPQEPVRKRFLVSDVTPEGLSYLHGSRTSTAITMVQRNSSGYQSLAPRQPYQTEEVPRVPSSLNAPISQ